MATAASVITSARYDLRDSSSNQYADTELLDYLNRGLRQLDSVLSTMSSDRVFVEDTSKTLSSSDNYVSAPDRCMKVRQLWSGTSELTPKNPDYIYYKRNIVGSTTGQPSYYAQAGENIIFERAADDDYSLKIYFDQRTDTLSSGTTMPYSDELNDPLRESIVILAKRRNEYDVNLDAVLYDFFLDAARSIVVKRRYNKKPYYLGF